MGNKLGAKATLKKLRRIVNERGHEYVYEAPEYTDADGDLRHGDECYYTTPEGKPSCLVGALLAGVAPGVLSKLNTYEWAELYEDGAPQVVSVTDLHSERSQVSGVDLDDYFTRDALQILYRVQAEQDNGKSWGKAVDLAATLI